MKAQALVNPNVLRWARLSSGFDIEQVAQKLGASADRLVGWEQGKTHPSIAQMRKLANLYKRPLPMFFLDQPPPDDAPLSDFRRFDPEASEPLSPALRFAVRDARARREAAIDLFEELRETPTPFSVFSKLGEDPERAAERIRGALTNDEPRTNADVRSVFSFWRDSAEQSGILVFQAEDIEIDEMRGFSISSRPLPVVVLNIKDAVAARTFSLLHEIAHITLNRGGLCVLEENGPQTDIQKTEAFCNHVAGAALMPAAALLQEPEVPRRRQPEIADESISNLSRRFGASREAILRRLVILGRIPLSFYQRKRQEYANEHSQRQQEGRQGGFAPPYTMAWTTRGKLFTRLVLESYDEERITSSDVATYLGMRIKWLDKVREAIREKSDREQRS